MTFYSLVNLYFGECYFLSFCSVTVRKCLWYTLHLIIIIFGTIYSNRKYIDILRVIWMYGTNTVWR